MTEGPRDAADLQVSTICLRCLFQRSTAKARSKSPNADNQMVPTLDCDCSHALELSKRRHQMVSTIDRPQRALAAGKSEAWVAFQFQVTTLQYMHLAPGFERFNLWQSPTSAVRFPVSTSHDGAQGAATVHRFLVAQFQRHQQ
jgi:hypothetical protein